MNVMKTTDIIKNQSETLEKMMDDRLLPDMGSELVGNTQPYVNKNLSEEQLKFSKYISAILYRLINASDTLKEHDIINKINVYMSGFENACIVTHKQKEEQEPRNYSLIFGPKLFSVINDLEKYKKAQCRADFLESLSGKGFLTEDDIAAVLAHELGHVYMQIKEPEVQAKINETSSDIFAVSLLKEAGYSPAAISKFFAFMALEKEYREKEYRKKKKDQKPDVYRKAEADAFGIAVDEHATSENRKFALDMVLLDQSEKKGTDWRKIETVPIPDDIDFFKIAQTFEYIIEKPKKEEKPKEEKKYDNYKSYEFSYDDVLAALQKDFNPVNLEVLLGTDYSFTPKKRWISYEQKIKDILKTCPYEHIYEDIPNADPDLLKNARIFIDIISKDKKDFQLKPLSDTYRMKYVSFPAYEEKTGEPYEDGALYGDWVSLDNMRRKILEYYKEQRKILLDEKSYGDFTLNDMIEFKQSMKYHDEIVRTFLDPIVLKRILSEQDDEKKLAYLLELLDSRKTIGEYQTRQIYVQETARLLAEKYGEDDGSSDYQQRIETEVLSRFVDQSAVSTNENKNPSHAPAVLTKEILEKFSQQIVSQRGLSLKMKECIETCSKFDKSSYSAEEQGKTEAFLETVLKDTDAVDGLLDFLTHDYDVSHLYDYLQEDILEKTDIGIQEQDLGKAHSRNYDAQKTFNEIADNFYQMHEMFWSNDIKARTVIIAKMLSSKAETTSQLFAYSIEKIIPPKVKNRQFLVDIIGAFISTYDIDDRPALMAAMLSAQRKQNSSADFSVGEPLKEFLENIGPAGIKLGQALGSSPAVPEDIRVVMQQMKHSSSQPPRWEMYEWYNATVPEDKQKKLGKIIGSGSYFVAVESDETVYSLLRPYARELAESKFEKMLKMCDILNQKDDKKYKDFSNIFRGIVEKAASMSEIETDLNIGEIQDKMARQIYHNPEDGSGKILDLGNGKTATLHVADWESFGETYKETKKVHGEHFNDFEDEEFKKSFSKAYLQLELENLFAGNPFDHDRHGAQMKIQKIDDTHYNVGIFDNGAMSDRPPTPQECRQLGNVLNNILNTLPNIKKPLEIVKYFTSKKRGFAHIFNDAVQQETKNAQSSDYLLAVQRGMLALNDYMRNLSDAEVLSVITLSINNVKKTTQKKVVDCITDENMQKLEDIVSYLSTQDKKSTSKSETKKKMMATSENFIDKLDKVMKRIKNNSILAKVAFTLSRDVNWLAKKMGLGVAGRSRLANGTDFFTDWRKRCRESIPKRVGTFLGLGLASLLFVPLSASALGVGVGKALLVSMGVNALFSSGYSFSDLPFIKRFAKKRSDFKLFDEADRLKKIMRFKTAALGQKLVVAMPGASPSYIAKENTVFSRQETVVSMTEPVAPPPVEQNDSRSQILLKNRISGR